MVAEKKQADTKATEPAKSANKETPKDAKDPKDAAKDPKNTKPVNEDEDLVNNSFFYQFYYKIIIKFFLINNIYQYLIERRR